MKIQALKVTQWLRPWEEVKFDAKKLRAKPSDHFYLFSLAAKDLRLLSGIYPRSAESRTRATDDLGIQRRHDSDRSRQISEYVRYGHPWADMSKAQRKSGEYSDLKKPGWLPTAIVINVLRAGDKRADKNVSPKDLVQIDDTKNGTFVILPDKFTGSAWKPTGLPPIEIIDGQHRLWAFGKDTPQGEFELPVVAFHGLDISWQAYLFYTINIKPKRITSSLAFDLYPLLRTEDWLEKFKGPIIYRETRAQELVDLLYSHPESPWHKRINMLGESGLGRMVSQAAWVRSLLATFVKSWEGRKISIGGLFGSPVGTDEQVLPWSRQEQAGFLIVAGGRVLEAIARGKENWQVVLRKDTEAKSLSKGDDPAFWSPHSLLTQDQGIRAFLSVVNDLCFLNADDLRLRQWGQGSNATGLDLDLVTGAVKSLSRTKIYEYLDELGRQIATFDWRASSEPSLSEEESLSKAAFRGSGGYRDLRRQLLLHLCKGRGRIATSAKKASNLLRYV